ncbi:polyribonucleotide nucleotidyltransferase [Cytobacillus sp. S13-E01]|uniref:polyribonucleotide nucleotidyltransferase n=1 Tax=Cytobacillus sp. S13-E01 TaxID=3031326 RepID=UPI0023D7DE56|nr:polyribonucleotide nucleotidyltransferase [Cytobacillus sp. S13-E01]MDF0728375.1 polyribonucleotide nucleotidyltransferase [Cytobacillus sp. S13-E01]
MDISSIMANNVAEIQRTLSSNLLKSQMATQAAQATVMLDDLTKAQASTQQAPHPTHGNRLDLKG